MSSFHDKFQANLNQYSEAQIERQCQFSKQRSSISKPQPNIQSYTTTKRKNMPYFMYLLWTVGMLVLSFQNILFFFALKSDVRTYYAIFSLTTLTLIMVMIGKYFASFQQMLNLYFLLDTNALSLTASIIGLIGVIQPTKTMDYFFGITLQYLAPIALFFGTGKTRIIIKFANFKQWQNVVFKMVIFLDGMCYFMIGIYIMFYNFKVTKGMYPETDQSWKNFSLLFVFGGLALYKQCCNLHNRFDQTDKLKYTYKLVDQVQQQKDLMFFHQDQKIKGKKTNQDKINPVGNSWFKLKKKQLKKKSGQNQFFKH